VKSKLRALNPNPINQKRKWTKPGIPSKSVTTKSLLLLLPSVMPLVWQSPVGYVDELTPTLLSVDLKLTNVCGVVVQNTSLMHVLKDLRLYTREQQNHWLHLTNGPHLKGM